MHIGQVSQFASFADTVGKAGLSVQDMTVVIVVKCCELCNCLCQTPNVRSIKSVHSNRFILWLRCFSIQALSRTCGHLTSILQMVQKRVVHIGRCNCPPCGRVSTTVIEILQEEENLASFCPPPSFFPCTFNLFCPGHANIGNGADLRT